MFQKSLMCLMPVLAIVGPGLLHADTITVDQGGGGDFDTITAAVNAASDGDVILVFEGVYVEGPIKFNGKRLTLNGLDAETSIVRSALKGDPVFQMVTGEPSGTAIANFTIEDAISTSGGGGIRVDNASNLILIGCIVQNNMATNESDGGGIWVGGGSTVLVDECLFSGNSADGSGGGLHVSDGSSIALTDSTFRGNSAVNVGGGARLSVPGNCTITGCSFEGNTARDGGGLEIGAPAIFTPAPAGLAPPRVISCAFSGNIAEEEGGAIFMYAYDDTDVIGSANLGYIDNCTFTRNVAFRYGVARVLAENAPSDPLDVVEMRGCILWKNVGGPYGLFEDPWNGGKPLVHEVRIDYGYCIIDQAMQDAYSSVDLEDNISARDPRFRSELGGDGTAGTGDEDLRVIPGSPAIDSGTDAVGLTSGNFDLAGLSRRVDDPNTDDGAGSGSPPIDRGAYEFNADLIGGEGYAIWLGGGATTGVLDTGNWFNGQVSNPTHRWTFDGAVSSTVVTVERGQAIIGGLDLATGFLVLGDGDSGVLRLKDGEGSADYDLLRVAPFEDEPILEDSIPPFTAHAQIRTTVVSDGVQIGSNGLVTISSGNALQILEGGTFRVDTASSTLAIDSFGDTASIIQSGTWSEPGLLNLGLVDLSQGDLSISGGYAQTGTRLDGEEATGLVTMQLNGEKGDRGSITVTGEATLAGGVYFTLGQQFPPIEAGEELTVLTASDGFGGTAFDFAVTYDYHDDDQTLFFVLESTPMLGGGESVGATVVSLADLAAGGASTSATEGVTLQDMVFADIDGDGFDDLVLSVDQGVGVDGSVVVLLNQGVTGSTWDGFGAYSPPIGVFTVGKQPRGLDVGFIDDNASLDVVVANYEDGEIDILLNSSTPGTVVLAAFGPALDADPFSTANASPLDVWVGNLDADPLSDILVTNETDGSVVAFQNTSSLQGTIVGNEQKSQPSLAIGRFTPKEGGSVRNDDTTGSSSDDDGVSSGSAGGAGIGPGIFMTWTGYATPSGSTPVDLAVADFNDDGFKDVATANEGGDSISILLGNALGYDPAATFPLGLGTLAPVSISAGDLDGDGDTDLAYIAERSGARVSMVMRNTLAPPDGSFGWVLDTSEDLNGNEPYLVRAHDVDNDGDDDVIALVASSTAFSGEEPTPPGFASTQMLANAPVEECLGDFDDDGFVGGSDLAQILGAWGTDAPAVELSGDNLIDGTDLAMLLGAWGPCNNGAALD